MSQQKNQCRIEKIIAGGKGLARIDGQVFFVPFVLPGELVEIEYSPTGKSFINAELLRVLEPSASRTEPPCPLFGKCGGCNLQHADAVTQAEIKVGIVEDHFRRIGKTDPPLLKLVSGASFGYRCRIKLHGKGETIGFMAGSTHTVVPVTHCPIAEDPINAFLKKKHSSMNKRGTFHLLSDGTRCFASIPEPQKLSMKILEKDFQVRSDLFFQSNRSLTEYLITDLRVLISEKFKTRNTAVDLYCGCGLFSAFLLDYFQNVTGIEACRDQKPFFLSNTGGKGKFWATDSSIGLKRIRTPVDLILMDPPRTGLDKATVSDIVRINPEMLIYVSCNPATQIRDLNAFQKQGYEIDFYQIYDFYPQTDHMETMAVLRRNDKA